MASSFSSFQIAKSGLQAAQAALHVTGQNISNINTEGYSRKRVDTRAVGLLDNNTRYAGGGVSTIGGGVELTKLSQFRDPYLDARYRAEQSKLAGSASQLEVLNDLSALFDEVENDVLDARFKDLITQLQAFSANASDPVVAGIVKTSSHLLVQTFNNTASQIERIRQQQLTALDKDMLLEVNTLISSIAAMNREIKSADISGMPALDLLDQRNMMLDSLSQYAGIEISAIPVEVGGGVTVYDISVDLVASGDKINLIHGGEYKTLSLQKSPDGQLKEPVSLVLSDAKGNPVPGGNGGVVTLTDGVLNDQLSTGALKSALDMLNGKGLFAQAGESTENGIGYYSGLLDHLAQSFADIMNAANSTSDTSYNKPLFTTQDGTSTSGITASNLSLSTAYSEDTGEYLTTSREGQTAGENILYMISELSTKRTYSVNGSDFFTGSFQECVTNISTTLGLHIKDVGRRYATYASTSSEIEQQRTAISAVDVNEEGINLVMYNQALTAASRLMTTLDEALDTIINRMGLVGR